MYYTIYKITNTLNNMIYIGMHKTNDLNDKYLGSGEYLKNAIKKHGAHSFIKDILYVFDNKQCMIEKEKELVTDEFIKRSDTYNFKLGGDGGWDHINNDYETLFIRRAKAGKKRRETVRQRYGDTYYAKIASKPKSELHKQHIRLSSIESRKRMTPEQLNELYEKRRNAKLGKKRDRCWIYNLKLKQSLFIKDSELETYLKGEWKKGRMLKFI